MPQAFIENGWHVAVWSPDGQMQQVEPEHPKHYEFPAPGEYAPPSTLVVEVAKHYQPQWWYGLVGATYEPAQSNVMIVGLHARRVASSFGPGESDSPLEPFEHSVLVDRVPGDRRRNAIALGIYPKGEEGLIDVLDSASREGWLPPGRLTISLGGTAPSAGSAHREAAELLLRIVQSRATWNGRCI